MLCVCITNCVELIKVMPKYVWCNLDLVPEVSKVV